MSDANKALTRRFIDEVFSKGNLAAVDELEPIGNVPPVEYEQQYYQAQDAPACGPESINELSQEPGAVHLRAQPIA